MKFRIAATACATALAVAAAGAAFAGPAGAQTTGDTDATFAIGSGALSITVPDSASFGTVAAGTTTVGGQLGEVEVTDLRGSASAFWTTSVSSTDFVTGAGGTNAVVPNDDIDYASGPATSSSGTGTFVGQPGIDLATGRVAAQWQNGVGNNSAAWDPSLNMTLSPLLIAGTYTATVTHSVA